MLRMRALTIAKQGSPVAANVEFVEDFPRPALKPGEAIVRTEASGLNHLDLWVGRGLPGIDLAYPRIGGSDGCGIVEDVGEGVDRSWIEKRVLLLAAKPVREAWLPGGRPAPFDITMIGEHENGAHAAFFAAPIENLLDIGDADPVQAVGIGLTHLTAWRMLVSRARLRPGQLVLITGIGGGVAIAALNIAKLFGCHTIVTSRHQSKLDGARDLGADWGVLDQGSDWSRQVRALTGKRGVDVCIDSIGKAVHLSCIKSLARGGSFITCGATTGADAVTDLARVFWNQLSILGSTMGSMEEFREVMSLHRSGGLTPVIDGIFEARDGRAAYERLEAQDQFGKIILRWSAPAKINA